jgi:uracil-DNA glycosylase
MNALPEVDAASARRREDMLRELNLYPLWQLRVPVAGVAPQVMPEAVQVQVAAVAEVEQAAQEVAQPAVIETAQVEVSQLGWAGLKIRVQTCSACNLRAGCLQTVFGTGDEKADWLFVGSWPTEDDEAKGEPFAGAGGQLLDNMLAAIKLKRGSNVYLANVVKCSGSIQRGPQADEIAQCLPYLKRQIQLLQPKIIVALGHAAATVLLGEDRAWNSLLGVVHYYRGQAQDGSVQAIPLVITHHPAALLLTPLHKAQTWRDLCLARDTMQHLSTATK